MSIQVFIVDDHPMVVAGLRTLLGQLEDITVAGTAGSAFETMPLLKKHTVDVLLLDINLPDVSGIDLCKKIHREFPGIKILGISTFSERSYISRMIGNGASGYLIKSASAEEIAGAIRTVLQGKLYLSLEMEHVLQPSAALTAGVLPALTKREKEVLQLIAEGFTNNQIAAQLFISPLTVDSHRKNLLMKLGVNNTAALIRLAIAHHLL
ncbi:response regulator transcription factor [Compostibacter hankyongensis]|uniref:Response regulator transcription factor n=1 Tax=Compostibacter hankyongensis TaxID=1007089 RepID=A0ABP8G7W6_9BACT